MQFGAAQFPIGGAGVFVIEIAGDGELGIETAAVEEQRTQIVAHEHQIRLDLVSCLFDRAALGAVVLRRLLFAHDPACDVKRGIQGQAGPAALVQEAFVRQLFPAEGIAEKVADICRVSIFFVEPRIDRLPVGILRGRLFNHGRHGFLKASEES